MSIGVWAQIPTADFIATPVEVCVGDSIDFTDLSAAGAAAIRNWDWNFGDGNSSTGQNPAHAYTAPGDYTITLVVTDANSQADPQVKIDYITVHPNPTVDFTMNGNGCIVPFDVSFANNSSSGANFTYAWDFGNTQTSALEDPAPVTYTGAGSYTVTLVVTNTATGCIDSFSQIINVSDFTTYFSGPSDICLGDPADFTDLSTIGADGWSWNFGDGNNSPLQNPSHTYLAAGVYIVTLTSQNSGSGCSDSHTDTVTVHDLPLPAFVADVTTGCSPLDVNFTNTSPFSGSFVWDFGDGNGFTGTTPPTHTYAADGSYTVTLSVIDSNGCAGSTALTDYIVISPLQPAFMTDVSSGCEPLIVQFTDISVVPNPTQDPIVSWVWDFGDGSPAGSGPTPPPHSYDAGVYTISLTITTQNGCQATFIGVDSVTVGTPPIVDFSVAPMQDCAKSQWDFTDLTTFNGTPGPGEVTWLWDFGDGGTNTVQNPTYEYPQDTGYFDVTLTVNWNGCISSATQVQAVYVLAPISIFTPDMTLVCNPGSFPVDIYFQDQSIHGELSDDMEMFWNWGDGTQTVLDDPELDDIDLGSTTHSFNGYGTFEVEQVIYNYTTGCEDSTTQFIHISELIPDYTVSNDSACVGSPITFTDNSSSSHPLSMAIFDYLDGSIDTGFVNNHTYVTSGTYDATLSITNSVGCVETISYPIEALALPQPIISPSATGGCAPITVDYNNNSAPVGNGVPIVSYTWTFPDMSTQTTTTSGPVQYSYATEGVFTVSLIAIDEFGCVSPSTSTNMVITKPTADFSMDSVVCDLENFLTTNQSVGATNYEWHVDGSLASTDVNFSGSFDDDPSPSYTTVTHDIMLVAIDQNGCMDSVTIPIDVSLPTADFNFAHIGANVNGQGEFTCPPVFTNLTDSSYSYGQVTGWQWDFGDGNSSTLQDPSNTYVFGGTYSATLSITDEWGCTDDTVLVDYLTISGPSGIPSWTSIGDICSAAYTFQVDSMDGVATVTWDLGDGTITNNNSQFGHIYDDDGSYVPVVTLTDPSGCQVTETLPTINVVVSHICLLYTSPSPRDRTRSRMPSSA